MCEFCETNDINRLFRGLKVAELVVECRVSVSVNVDFSI